MALRPEDIDRFYSKLTVAESGCWLWLGTTQNGRYGFFSLNRRNVYAHRLSWEIHNGPIPEGMYICHACDTPLCCRPSHLFLGDGQINKDDCVAKDRHAYGERIGNAKLTAEQVIEIRALLCEGQLSHGEIGKLYGVSAYVVFDIKRKRSWAWLPEGAAA